MTTKRCDVIAGVSLCCFVFGAEELQTVFGVHL